VGALTDIHDSALNPLGTIQVIDGKEYIYLQGSASIAATSAVSYDEAFLATLIDTDVAATLVGPVAVALAAVVANKYGWFQIGGSASIKSGTVADNGKVYATSTAGQVDDAFVQSAQILGAVFRSADSGGVATVQLNRPWIGLHDSGS
jgi:hypothetical protein